MRRIVDGPQRGGGGPIHQRPVPLHKGRPVGRGHLGGHLGRRPQRPADAVQLYAARVGNPRPVGPVAGLELPGRRLHPPQEVQDPLGIGQVTGPGQRGRGERRVPRPDVAPRRRPTGDRYAVGLAQHVQVQQGVDHQRPVEPGNLGDGARGQPLALLGDQAVGVGRPGQHPGAGHHVRRRGLGDDTAGPQGDRVGVQRAAREAGTGPRSAPLRRARGPAAESTRSPPPAGGIGPGPARVRAVRPLPLPYWEPSAPDDDKDVTYGGPQPRLLDHRAR